MLPEPQLVGASSPISVVLSMFRFYLQVTFEPLACSFPPKSLLLELKDCRPGLTPSEVNGIIPPDFGSSPKVPKW